MAHSPRPVSGGGEVVMTIARKWLSGIQGLLCLAHQGPMTPISSHDNGYMSMLWNVMKHYSFIRSVPISKWLH